MLLKNARLIDPASGHDGPGDLRIREGIIIEVSPSLEPQADEPVHDLEGAALSPALIDLRCWANPESRGSSGLETTALSAAAGGIATVLLAPDSGRGMSTAEDFAPVENASLTSPVRLLVSGLAVDENAEMGEIGLMLQAGAALVGDGGNPIADTRLARRILAYASTFETWVSLACEDAFLRAETCASESDLSMRLGLSSRPAASERLAIERGAALAELTGAQILFDRISTREGMAALEGARARGLDLAASIAIPHLLFNEVDTGGFDARYRLDPPLRPEDDRQALIEAIKNGDVDAIVSDHRACTGEAKAHPFPDAAAGSANLEALLPALCTLAKNEDIGLVDVLRLVTSRPAEILGLSSGQLQPGATADLVVFDPDAPVTGHRTQALCKASSAFENRRMFGKVLLTFVEGVIVFQPEG